jgi:hypothetical protein
MQENAGRADAEDGVPFTERHIDGKKYLWD